MLIRTTKELGLFLRDRRRAMGLSQQALAVRLGVSRGWLIDVEHGKPRAAIGLVLRALKTVGVTLHAATGGDDPPATPRPSSGATNVDAIVDRSRRKTS